MHSRVRSGDVLSTCARRDIKILSGRLFTRCSEYRTEFLVANQGMSPICRSTELSEPVAPDNKMKSSLWLLVLDRPARLGEEEVDRKISRLGTEA